MGFKSRAIQPPVPLAAYLSASIAAQAQQNAANLVQANAYANWAAESNSLQYMAGYQVYRPTQHVVVTDDDRSIQYAEYEPIVPRNRTSVIAKSGFGGKPRTMARAA